MQPFAILPKVVWEQLLEQLEEPIDKLKIINIHPTLQKCFEYKRQEWLFATVLPIFIKNFDSKTRLEDDKDLNKSILSSRLVSKLVCKSIDKYVESYWNTNYSWPYFIHEKSGDFMYGRNIHRFLEEMKEHPEERPPLLSQNLNLEFPFFTSAEIAAIANHIFVNNEDEQNNQQIEYPTENDRFEILEKVGRHTKGVFMGICTSVPRFLERMPYQLETTLAYLPNLQLLSLIWVDRYYFALFPKEHRQKVGLKQMPSLMDLNIHCIDSSIMDLFNFEDFFPQIKKLSMGFLCLWKEKYYKSAGIFPNLQFLQIWLGDTDMIEPNSGKKLLSILKSLDAPKLEQIGFKMYMEAEREKVTSLIRAVKVNGLYILRQRFPDVEWECKIGNDGDKLDLLAFVKKSGKTEVVPDNSNNTGLQKADDDCDATQSFWDILSIWLTLLLVCIQFGLIFL